AAPRQLQRVLATEPAARARHDRHLAVETDVSHGPQAPEYRSRRRMRGGQGTVKRPLHLAQKRRQTGPDVHILFTGTLQKHLQFAERSWLSFQRPLPTTSRTRWTP